MGREQALSCCHWPGVLAKPPLFHGGFKFSFWPFFCFFSPCFPFCVLMVSWNRSWFEAAWSRKEGRQGVLKTQRNHVFLHEEQGLGTAQLWQGTELHQQ